jgi:hypothetical protein
MKKILGFILAIIIGAFSVTAVIPAGEAVAATREEITRYCEHNFLGMRPWYSGLVTMVGDKCIIESPTDGASNEEIARFVWRIVLNISSDIALFVGYLAIFFIIFGGYKYIMSTGEPGKITQAKQILTNAVIGLVIAILATIIVNTIIMVAGSAADNGSGGTSNIEIVKVG